MRLLSGAQVDLLVRLLLGAVVLTVLLVAAVLVATLALVLGPALGRDTDWFFRPAGRTSVTDHWGVC